MGKTIFCLGSQLAKKFHIRLASKERVTIGEHVTFKNEGESIDYNLLHCTL